MSGAQPRARSSPSGLSSALACATALVEDLRQAGQAADHHRNGSVIDRISHRALALDGSGAHRTPFRGPDQGLKWAPADTWRDLRRPRRTGGPYWPSGSDWASSPLSVCDVVGAGGWRTCPPWPLETCATVAGRNRRRRPHVPWRNGSQPARHARRRIGGRAVQHQRVAPIVERPGAEAFQEALAQERAAFVAADAGRDVLDGDAADLQRTDAHDMAALVGTVGQRIDLRPQYVALLDRAARSSLR